MLTTQTQYYLLWMPLIPQKNTKRDRENKAVMTSLVKQLTVGR